MGVDIEPFLVGEQGNNVVAVGRGCPVNGKTTVEVLDFGEFRVGL